MKIILTEKVNTLGNIGEVVNVSQGFGRNYLIPNKLAVLADESNKKQLENQKRALGKKIAGEKAAAVALKGQIDKLSLDLVKRVGANGKLFGTVTNADLAKELEAKGIVVERRMITVDNPIKSVGKYVAKVKLFADVDASFNISVTMDPAQAEEMKLKQKEAEAQKARQKELAANAAENTEATDANVPMTEEQKLRAEADKILRG